MGGGSYFQKEFTFGTFKSPFLFNNLSNSIINFMFLACAEQRLEESRDVIAKYPDRIPVCPINHLIYFNLTVE